MKRVLLLVLTTLFGLFGTNAFAQGCAGGIYLNPQIIRGEGLNMTESAAIELTKFVSATGISVNPFYSVKQRVELSGKIDTAIPPCWIYGNPVIGFSAGKNYVPLIINMEVISPAVLIIGDLGTEKDGKPKNLRTLPPAKQTEILERLKKTICYGMDSGVTTALVYGESICMVDQVIPKTGHGQSYLPQKAAFQWKPNEWIAVVMREASAAKVTMKDFVGLSDQIRLAELTVVPVSTKSWGYGMYVHSSVDVVTRKKLLEAFLGIKNPPKNQQTILDIDDSPDFRTPSTDEYVKMKKALNLYLEKK